MAEQEVGNLVVKLGMDGTGFQNGVSNLNRQMKVVQSEFQAASAKLGNFGNSTDGLNLKADSLSKQLDLQKQKVSALESAFQRSADSKGRDAKATQDLEIKLNKARAQLSTMEHELKTTNTEIENQGTSWKKLSNSLDSVKQKTQATGAAIASAVKAASVALAASVTTAVTAVGGFGIKYDAELEQARIAFETLLGSADKAKSMIGDLQKFAADTPFEFPDLQKSAKLMLAMGFSADQIMPNLKAVGNAVSAIGGGAETLDGVTMALGQMLTKGKVSAEEMNQLAERGIPAWDLMAQKMGMSKQQLMNLSAQGKVFSDQAVPALIEAMGTKFAGAMDKQSQSFSGLMSTLKDNANMLMGQIMEPVFNKLKEILPQIIDFVNKISAAFKNGGFEGVLQKILPPEVANFLTESFKLIKESVDKLKASFLSHKDEAVAAMNVMKEKLGPIFEQIKHLIQNLVDVFVVIWNEWGDDITKIFIVAWDMIMGVFKGVLKVINGVLDVFIGLFTGDWKRMGEGLKEIWSGLWDGVGSILKGAWGILKAVFGGLWDSIKNWFVNLAKDAIQWGGDIVRGLGNGIEALAGWIKDKVLGFVGGIGSTIKDFFGIASPSKLTTGYGENIGQGLANGIDSTKGIVQTAAEGLANVVETQVNRTKSLIAEFGPGGQFSKLSQDTIDSVRFANSAAGTGNFGLATSNEGVKGIQAYINDQYNRLFDQARATGSKLDTGVLMDMAKANADSLLMGKTPQYQNVQVNVTVPAKDLAEVKTVTDLFGKLKQTSRALGVMT